MGPEDVREALRSAEITQDLATIVGWLDNPPIENPTEALIVAEKLVIPELVNQLILRGAPIELSENIVAHTLDADQAIAGWAKGYRVVFDGVVESDISIEVLREALKHGMPVKSLRSVAEFEDTDLEKCKDLEELFLNDEDTKITNMGLDACKNLKTLKVKCETRLSYCPLSVTYLHDGGESEFKDISGNVNLRKLELRWGTRIRRFPTGIEDLTIHGPIPDFDFGAFANLRVLKIENPKLSHRICLAVANLPETLQEFTARCCNISNLPSRLQRLSITGCYVRCIFPGTVETLYCKDSRCYGVENMEKLRVLEVIDTIDIVTCPMSVENLSVIGRCQLQNIQNHTSIKTLDISCYSDIGQLPPNLEELTMRYQSSAEGVKRLQFLKKLDLLGNPKPCIGSATVEDLNVGSLDTWRCGTTDMSKFPRLKILRALDSLGALKNVPPDVTMISEECLGVLDLAQLYNRNE